MVSIAKYSLTLLALNVCLVATAIPAKPGFHQQTMPDGSVMTVRTIGDEHFHYFQTADGLNILPNALGFRYVSDAELQAGFEKARKSVQRRAGFESSYPTMGVQKGLVILVQYQDYQFSIDSPQQKFYDLLNKQGYSENGGTGSARDWFSDNSCGQFLPDFDVYGPVTLSHDRSYYGANDSSGDDVRPHEMVIEACQQLDDTIDFTEYDRDNDGIVDNVYIFYPGYGENLNKGTADMIWPHSDDIESYTLAQYIFDGVRINHYACSNEINDNGSMEGIGTFVHEFSHVLGLPDLYATNYSYAFTPGEWSVLDSGTYNNDSRTPPYYTAYERYTLGWLTPKEIGKPARHTLDEISQNQAYIIRTQNDNEFFVLENRQQNGWDKYIPGHGMLIWHIDYSEALWTTNTVNNRRSHQNVDIEEADNIESEGTVTGDPFPGTSNVTSFTDDTEPSMVTWDGSRQEKPITDISEKSGIITFTISGGKDELASVTALDATEVTPTSFVANWEASENDVEYLLSVYTSTVLPSGKVTYNYVEGFNSLNVGNATSMLIENLTASTTYKYSVKCYDSSSDMESVASNEIIVETAAPTFDLMAPVAEEATDVSLDGFTAVWNAMDGADSYQLAVYSKEFEDPEYDTVDFADGIAALPEGWDTNSNLTYSLGSYSGNAIPSLRFSNSGNYISTPEYADGIRSIEFWHRGVNTPEDSKLVVRALCNGEWQLVDNIPIENEAGGKIFGYVEMLPNDTRSVSITFEPTATCSVAIDDIIVGHGGLLSTTPVAEYDHINVGNVTNYPVRIPMAEGDKYYYRVAGVNGETVSQQSNEIRVRAVSGIANVLDNDMRIRIERGRVILSSSTPTDYTLYNIQGAIAAQGVCRSSKTLQVVPGIYILHLGEKDLKICIK